MRLKDQQIKNRIWNSYRSMRQVIYNPDNQNHKFFLRLGTPLEEDLGRFQEFYTWVLDELGPPPNASSRLLRKTHTRGYIRSNLEWGTHRQQGQRLLRCHQIRFRGRSQSPTDWSRELGINYHKIWRRLRAGTLDMRKLVEAHGG